MAQVKMIFKTLLLVIVDYVSTIKSKFLRLKFKTINIKSMITYIRHTCGTTPETISYILVAAHTKFIIKENIFIFV